MLKVIQIVPTLGAASNAIFQQAATQPPNFTYRSGPLLQNVDVFTIFWGTAWQQQAYAFMARNLNTFLSQIVQSQLVDQLREYSIAGQTISRGTFSGTVTLSQPSLPPVIFGKSLLLDSAIQNMLQNAVNTGAIPPSTPNRLFFVFLPAGITVFKDWEFSCAQFCGYHNAVNTSNGQIFYAVMPYPNCLGCNSGFLPFDALTITISHELCEAITDAIPGQGWYDDRYGEIGDVCAWYTKKIGLYTVQSEWSQSTHACA